MGKSLLYISAIMILLFDFNQYILLNTETKKWWTIGVLSQHMCGFAFIQ